MTVRIVTDSGADLPEELIREFDIAIAPIYIYFGQEVYKDRIDMQSMIDMEYRLRVHIHVLSKCISEDDAEPGDAPDTFLYLAARLSSNNDEEINRAAKLANALIATR